MSRQSLQLWDSGLQSNQPASVRLLWEITGAKTIDQMNYMKAPVLAAFDSYTQATVDAYLGTTDDPDVSVAFGSTALGTDALGFIVRMQGQAQRALAMKYAVSVDGTVTEGLVEASQAALTDALSTALGNSTNGDLHGRVIVSGLDAATSGFIDLELFFESK